MKRRKGKGPEAGSVAREPGLIDYGRYPIPVLEQTYGLTSQDNVVFGQDNDRVWELLDLTFQSIRTSSESARTRDVIAEVESQPQSAGTITPGAPLPHPSFLFAEQVVAAIKRCLPEATVTAPADPALGDYRVSYHGRSLLVEIKWKADLAQPFAASTLQHVIERISDEEKLLVVVDAISLPSGEKFSGVKQGIGSRGKILTWQDENDDRWLREALMSLLEI